MALQTRYNHLTLPLNLYLRGCSGPMEHVSFIVRWYVATRTTVNAAFMVSKVRLRHIVVIFYYHSKQQVYTENTSFQHQIQSARKLTNYPWDRPKLQHYKAGFIVFNTKWGWFSTLKCTRNWTAYSWSITSALWLISMSCKDYVAYSWKIGLPSAWSWCNA